MRYGKYRRTNRRFATRSKINNGIARHRFTGKRAGGFKSMKHSTGYFLKKAHK